MDETADGGFDLNGIANGIFGLLGKKIDADAQVKARQSWLDQQQAYGVDAFGRTYLRGQPGTVSVLGSPLVAVGVGIAAITLLVFALKS